MIARKGKRLKSMPGFVKPVLFPVLSEFCKTLTTITQEQVDQGISLPQACQELQTLVCRTDALFCSWGYYDRKMFQQSCSRFGLPYPFSDRHVSLKHAHRDYYGYGKKMGMKQALSYHGLKLDGVHHRGIDDARNIAKIVTRMLEDGYTVP